MTDGSPYTDVHPAFKEPGALGTSLVVCNTGDMEEDGPVHESPWAPKHMTTIAWLLAMHISIITFL